MSAAVPYAPAVNALHIIGDDIAGCTLALRSRLRGRDVTVHAGPTSTFAEVFALPAPYRDLMLKTGVALEAAPGLVEVDAGPTITGPDGRTHVLPGVGSYGPTFGRVWGSATASVWGAVMRQAADIWGHLRNGDFPELPSLDALLGDDPHLQAFGGRFATELGLDPHLAYGGLVVLPYLAQTFGLWSIAGGNAALHAELRERCVARDVRFTTEQAPADAVAAISVLDPLRPLLTGAGGTTATHPEALGLPFVALGAEWTTA